MRIHVRPLRPGVPADNGSRVMLAEHGAVRDPGPYWDRMVQIGAVESRQLPARGQTVMIRPVGGARVLASGHRADQKPAIKKGGDDAIGAEGAEVAWTEAHEGALADQLIRFPEPTKSDIKKIEQAAEKTAQEERELDATEYDLTHDNEAANV